MAKIGQKIKEARKIKNISQNDLAKAIGVSDKSISAYEAGRIHPSLPVLEKIAQMTDHSVSYFVEDSVEATIAQRLDIIEKQFTEIKKLLKQVR